MKAERLFQILGLVDESLIEEADTASSPAAGQRPPTRVRRLAAAAWLAVIWDCGNRIWERAPAAPEMPRWPVENPAVTATARALPSCPTPGRSFR